MKTYIQFVVGFGLVLGASATSTTFAGSDRELLFSAPIEQLDRTTDTVTVLGQQFHSETDQLNVGQLVRVYGVLAKDGSVGDAVVQPTEGFAANGDPVFVKGVVTNTDAILGRAEVDGMTIDYTSELANPDFVAPSVGDVIAVAASQPLNKTVLVAFATGNDAYDVGATGTGFSVATSGLRPGQAAATATGGSVAAGMNGGGVISSGMNGGGVISSGMNGGGVISSGMNGGGVISSGMNGGGIISSGMNGGGVISSGMNGGGVISSGMNGGGIISSGMNGGGIISSGMNGGGIQTAGMNGGGRN